MSYNPDDIATVGQMKTYAQRSKATNAEHEEMLNELGMNSASLGVTLTHETFTFELDDGTLINKELVLWPLM